MPVLPFSIRDISLRRLMVGLLIASLLAIVGLSVSLYQGAKRADQQLIASVEARLLSILKETGVSGLAVTLERVNQALVPGRETIEIALWRRVADTQTLVRETTPGVAAFLNDTGPHRLLNGQNATRHWIDVAKASQDWAFAMGDVVVGFSVFQPTQETKIARNAILTIALAYGMGLVLAGMLYRIYLRRYQRSITAINETLGRYAQGDTGLMIDGDLPAPELRDLGHNLNVVLPKIDKVFEDLRQMSAHAAHEVRIPLQVMLAQIEKLEPDVFGTHKQGQIADIKGKIGDANARLDSVLQLFRLQANQQLDLDAEVAIDEILSDLTYDLEGMAHEDEKIVDLDIEAGIFVAGNSVLLRLLIDNLLTNAKKYRRPRSTIVVTLRQDRSEFYLSVENEGDISGERGDLLFDRYEQGAAHEAREGVGLGLSLVKVIAQKHGFDIKLTSQTQADGRPSVRAELTGPVLQVSS